MRTCSSTRSMISACDSVVKATKRSFPPQEGFVCSRLASRPGASLAVMELAVATQFFAGGPHRVQRRLRAVRHAAPSGPGAELKVTISNGSRSVVEVMAYEKEGPMDTATHHLFSVTLFDLFEDAAVARRAFELCLDRDWFYQCGTVRPDNGRTDFVNHDKLGECVTGFENNLAQTLQPPSDEHRAQTLGVAYHYAEDSLDVSKVAQIANPPYRQYLRDFMYAFALSAFQLFKLRWPSVRLDGTSVEQTFRSMHRLAMDERPAYPPEVEGQLGFGPDKIVLPFLHEYSLNPMPKIKRYERTLGEHVKFMTEGRSRGMLEFFAGLNPDDVAASLGQARDVTAAVLRRGNFRSAFRDRAQVYYHAADRQPFGGYGRTQPVERRHELVLPYVLDCFGTVTAVAEHVCKQALGVVADRMDDVPVW